MNNNKYIMVDMDGTICSYEINGSVILDDWFEPGIFTDMLPVTPVIDKLRKLQEQGYNLFVLSASPSSLANQEKLEWLQLHAPFIKHIYFVGETNRKVDMLERICLNRKIKFNDVYVLDDTHSILIDAEGRGFKALHPSTFLAKQYLEGEWLND